MILLLGSSSIEPLKKVSVGQIEFTNHPQLKAHIDNYKTWIHGHDEKLIKLKLGELIQESGFTILNFMDHFFEPQGYTGLWLLAESHCALHTFPEENKSYVELSSCSETMYIQFKNLISSYFEIVD